MKHRPQRTTSILIISTALALVGDATLYAVLPARFAAFGITAGQVGWMLSVNRLVRIPLNMLAGVIASRLGPKRPYVLGLALGAASTAGYALAHSFWTLLLARALWGVSWSLLIVAAYTSLLNVTTLETRGKLAGFYSSGSFLGGALGAMLGGYLVDEMGARGAMTVLAFASVLGVLVGMFLPKSAASD